MQLGLCQLCLRPCVQRELRIQISCVVSQGVMTGHVSPFECCFRLHPSMCTPCVPCVWMMCVCMQMCLSSWYACIGKEQQGIVTLSAYSMRLAYYDARGSAKPLSSLACTCIRKDFQSMHRTWLAGSWSWPLPCP